MTTEEGLAAFYRDKAVLITGGLGFIGSNLARRLAELEAEVLLIDSLIPDYGGNLFNIDGVTDRVHVNIADVRDQNSMNYLVRGQDILFNLAGQVSHIDSMLDPYTDLEINCRSQLSLLEACRHNNPDVKVVYAGTRQVYGKPRYLPVDEDHLLQPTDVNGINTMAGEWYHILYNNVYGVRACSLRLTNTYGPRLLVKHNRQGFIGWFIRQALDGQEIQIFGDGLQQRDMIFVDDAVEAFLLAGMSEDANGQIFNVGGKERVSLLEFVQVLVETARCGSYQLVPFPAERKSIDIGDYYADCSKIRRTLGWEARTDLREGLKKTVPFYRKHREHYW
ncbi:MAG: NAD-dependent epimerase/dehydratase family protein [Dehalococcoidia bacterium]|nr:NAD-dependent epimerase/dehydratase family protein [Dehalococcoidia bacterium]